MQATPLDENSYDKKRTKRKQATLLSHAGRFEFWSDRFDVVKEKPLVYWWDKEFLKRYAETPKMEEKSEVRGGMHTSNNSRYVRKPWEIEPYWSIEIEFSLENEPNIRHTPTKV